jgi:hypothetical protein
VKERLCNQVLNDHSLNSLAYRLVGEDRDDLIQELALIICEKEDKELEKLSQYFNFWCVRVMINMTGARGNFTKLYSKKYINVEDLNFDSLVEYDGNIDEILDRVDEILKSTYWYKRELFKLYVECGSLRKVQGAVGINYSSVYNTVREVKQTIIDKL